MKKEQKIIYQSSLPQSGSELLQVIMHQNPDIYGSATSPLLEYWYGARSNFALPEVKSQPPMLMHAAFMEFCVGGAAGYYRAITERPVILDKSRGWIQYYRWLEQAYIQKPKMICMIRDPRSILSHMEKVFRLNQHNPTCGNNPAEMTNLTTAQRVSTWLSGQPVGLAFERLHGALTEGYADDIHFVRYEDLTEAPATVLEGIYNYLEMEPFDHDFDNVVKEVEEDDSHYGPFGSHTIHSKVEPHAPDYYNVLGRDICDQVQQSFAWFYSNFYR
jgi:sulfotransferase